MSGIWGFNLGKLSANQSHTDLASNSQRHTAPNLTNPEFSYAAPNCEGAYTAYTPANSLDDTILQDELVQLNIRMRKTVLFITHDISEAILLGDRVGIMRAGPASAIKEIIDIRLPRPRRRSGIEFGELYERIGQSISDEVRCALKREDSLLR